MFQYVGNKTVRSGDLLVTVGENKVVKEDELFYSYGNSVYYRGVPIRVCSFLSNSTVIVSPDVADMLEREFSGRRIK